MARKMYIYRAEMRKNGKDEPVIAYLYARNAKMAKEFCARNFEHFDNFLCVKFGETTNVGVDVGASFIKDGGEAELVKSNIAGNGEVFAERDEERW